LKEFTLLSLVLSIAQSRITSIVGPLFIFWMQSKLNSSVPTSISLGIAGFISCIIQRLSVLRNDINIRYMMYHWSCKQNYSQLSFWKNMGIGSILQILRSDSNICHSNLIESMVSPCFRGTVNETWDAVDLVVEHHGYPCNLCPFLLDPKYGCCPY
jgi:hypothetical protein